MLAGFGRYLVVAASQKDCGLAKTDSSLRLEGTDWSMCISSSITTSGGRILIHRLRPALPISPNCVFDASLVPETCLESPSLPVCFLDSIRQAKAKIRHGASCPTISMAPVLAITSLVARTAL